MTLVILISIIKISYKKYAKLKDNKFLLNWQSLLNPLEFLIQCGLEPQQFGVIGQQGLPVAADVFHFEVFTYEFAAP